MDQWLVISLRILHILTGAAWVGGAFVLFGFLIPTARRLGPETGSSYLNRFLDHPWFSRYISSMEGLAVLTGLILFWNASGGLRASWLASATGIGFAAGGTAAVIALVVSGRISAGLGKLYRLGVDIAARPQTGDDWDSAFYEAHSRLSRLAGVYLAMLLVAIAGMASARYLS